MLRGSSGRALHLNGGKNVLYVLSAVAPMRITKDLLSGLMFLGFGIAAVAIAQNYTLGSLGRMGSGYFPTMMAGLLIVLGLMLFVRAIVRPDSSETVGRIEFRPVFFISAAIIAFGFLIGPFGVVVALAALIIIGRFAGREGSAIEVALMVVVLTAIVIAIFVYGLNVRLYLGPW